MTMPTPSAAPGGALASLRDRVAAEVAKVVVGQDEVVDLLFAAAVVGGHVLLEGVPGVAKTLMARAWSAALGLDFRRVQFTPDMLPSDLSGTVMLRFDPTHSGDGGGRQDLAFRPGPIFTNVLLADEINRTPPKTQAALLEAMQEAQVSVDGVSHPLPQPFLVVATQNPIEYEGTYPLPEAQLDRFLLKVDVGYPSAADEEAILRLGHRGVAPATLDDVQVAASAADIAAAQAEVDATTRGRRGRRLRGGRRPPHPGASQHRPRREPPGGGPPAGSRQGRCPAPGPWLRDPGRRRRDGAARPPPPPDPAPRG